MFKHIYLFVGPTGDPPLSNLSKTVALLKLSPYVHFLNWYKEYLQVFMGVQVSHNYKYTQLYQSRYMSQSRQAACDMKFLLWENTPWEESKTILFLLQFVLFSVLF